MIIPKDQENIRLNIDVIKPNTFFSFVICAKISVDENTVKNTVKILLKRSNIVKYLFSVLVKDC